MLLEHILAAYTVPGCGPGERSHDALDSVCAGPHVCAVVSSLPCGMPTEVLRSAFNALEHRPFDAAARLELRRRFGEFVRQAREAQWPPERMLAEVKQLLREAGYRTSTLKASMDRNTRDAIADEVVNFCIKEYFGEKQAGT